MDISVPVSTSLVGGATGCAVPCSLPRFVGYRTRFILAKQE